MASWKKFTAIAALLSVVVGLTGCGAAPTTKIFEAFEKASSAEVNVTTALETLKTLEDKDEKQYINILDQGKQDNRNVQTLIDNTNKALEERKQAIEQVKVHLDDARSQMGELDKAIAKLKDEELKKQAEQAYTAYVKRYDTFKALHEKYGQWLEREQFIYDELKSQNTKLKSITTGISERNEVYRQVEELKTQFNDYTTQFNTLKSDFYKGAGLQVTKTEGNQDDNAEQQEG
ncbi:YkyA family protein [Paenibacillus sp. OSY-SE]|uniref:YkyA family protein n=1 Tax=Paenibacillus sp. OSY-SE TaxID=1196323 RepID=UPI0002D924EF|nr:YkyA family protein [Paenibacillus sp. OSY-SE]